MIKKLYLKIVTLFLILSICMFSLFGCYNIKNIDNLAYVIALGIDIGENSPLKISFQLSIPSNSSNNSSSSSSQSSDSIVNTVECSTINSGITLINSYLGKIVDLSHCSVIVFSEELASLGISEYIYTLMNNVQLHPSTDIIVSKCNAEYFLNNSKPIIDKLSARYYHIITSSNESTGYTEPSRIGNFYNDMNDTFIEPHAILGNINTESTHIALYNGINSDSSYVAGETPISEETSVETLGIAVFSGDTLVGELNCIETLCHLIIISDIKSCSITIPSPFNNSNTIDLNIFLNKKTKNTVDIINGNPYISCDVNLSARIVSLNDKSNYLTESNINKIENYANIYLKENIKNFLYKTSKNFKSDINGFGKYAIKHFSTWDKWNKYNWLSNYQNAFFNVNVNTDILSSYMLIGS